MIATVSISLVSLLPLIAVEFLEDEVVKQHPGFAGRMNRVLENRTDLVTDTCYMERGPPPEGHSQRLLALSSIERLKRVLRYLLYEEEFLSPFSIRSLSMRTNCVCDGS